MRTLLFIITFLTFQISSTNAQQKETLSLTIDIQVTKYNKGNILLALYDSEEGYMKNAIRSFKVEVKDNKASIVIDNLEKGDYGFSFFHDVDSNGKLNKNFVGIPKEPYGFSNDKAGTFGPPDFDKIKFSVQENMRLEVSVK